MQQKKRKSRSPSKKSSRTLLFGYFVIMLLFLVFFGLGINELYRTDKHIKTIVNTNNVKTRLLVSMQHYARERTLALYRMVNQPDPFERDESYQKFSQYGQSFLVARHSLLDMDLSVQEQLLIEEQGRLSRIAVPYQNSIIDLLQQDNISKALKILINQSIPAQNNVITTINSLINLQHTNNEIIAKNLSQNLNNNIVIIVIAGITGLLLTLLTAFFVTRYIVKTEKQLYIEKELAQITLHSIGDGIITVDKNYIIQTLNPAAEKLTGKTSAFAKGKNILTLYNNSEENPLNKNLDEHSHKKSLFDYTLTHDDGKKFEVEHTIAPIIDQSKNIYGAVIILRDVTAMRSMEKRLSYQASHDSLTGLINRREFETRLNHAIHNAQTDDTVYSLCFLDLDKFKIINDTSGHAAGDEFLKQISHIIQAKLRNSDILARLGGDEFGILLDGCSLKHAEKICHTIIDEVKNTRFVWGKNVFESGASIGIAPINKHSNSVTDVMSIVDAACYEAKDKGRNRVQIFEPENEDFVKHQQETSWIQILKQAIEKNHFELYAQEILAINPTYPTPKTVEILVRLNHKNKVISPDSFIPTAERYNMMPMIDAWIINHTFDFINQYKETHNSDIRVAINLSGQSLSDDALLNLITELLRKNKNLNKELICFEITETAAIANLNRAIEFISTIKQIGCKFSLDDFGSGLSSFSYLKNMPVDNLKIDGIFIREIVSDSIDKAFVESIHNIGKMMGIKTTAEYVENADILECVKKIGIDYAQGYHIAKPVPISTFL